MDIGAPEYLEAYPMLRMRDLDRRVIGEEASTIEWVHWPELRQATFGTLKYSWLSPSKLGIEFDFGRPYGDAPSWGDEQLDIIYVPIARDANRPQFRCPNCGDGVSRLFYKSFRWLCQVCHGLSYRSKLMPRRQYATEQFDYLSRLLKNGRPPGMRVTTYWQLCDRLSAYHEERGKYGADSRNGARDSAAGELGAAKILVAANMARATASRISGANLNGRAHAALLTASSPGAHAAPLNPRDRQTEKSRNRTVVRECKACPLIRTRAQPAPGPDSGKRRRSRTVFRVGGGLCRAA